MCNTFAASSVTHLAGPFPEPKMGSCQCHPSYATEKMFYRVTPGNIQWSELDLHKKLHFGEDENVLKKGVEGR